MKIPTNITTLIKEVETNILKRLDENKCDKQEPPPFLAAVKNLEKQVNKNNMKVINQLKKSNENPEENIERDKRTRIVLKPKNVQIANSRHLRKAINEHFPDLGIEEASCIDLVCFDAKSARGKCKTGRAA